MRILIALTAICSIILFSCQKEVSFDSSNSGGSGGGGSSSGTLLVKKVDKSGSDSNVYIYTYNSNNKLISQKLTGAAQGSPIDREYRYYRNGSGILTHYSVIDADLVLQGIDSASVFVHYNSSTSQYTSYAIRVETLGLLLDSSVLVYDGSGKIIEEDIYQSQTGLGNDYFLSGKINYTYTAGNLTQLNIHDLDDTGAEVFTAQTTCTYDSKINPLHFDNESFVMGHPEWISANNIAGEQLSDSNGSVDDQTVTFIYVYNSGNRPETAVITAMPDNTIVNSSFYYQ